MAGLEKKLRAGKAHQSSQVVQGPPRSKKAGAGLSPNYHKFKDIGLPRNSILYIVIPDLSATVIPRNDSDEESYCKDFSLPLEMTVWTGFERLFELLSAKTPPRRHKPLFTKPS
ncbi:MAG TPA: hypothetical protein VKN73_07460, partial [Desulfosalsimonadaceae bacterium]|nr:hypothetical protein [Desulfosalsimonadaceae bacterium]